jgi:hypothetical protein
MNERAAPVIEFAHGLIDLSHLFSQTFDGHIRPFLWVALGPLSGHGSDFALTEYSGANRLDSGAVGQNTSVSWNDDHGC